VGARIPLLADDPNRFEAALLLGPAQASEKIVDHRVEPGNYRFAGLVEEVFDPSGPHRSSNKVECRRVKVSRAQNPPNAGKELTSTLQEQEEVCVRQVPRDDEQGDGDACDGECREGRVGLTRSSGRADFAFACVTRGQGAGKCREVVCVVVNNQEN
jgi:hypothetical protein